MSRKIASVNFMIHLSISRVNDKRSFIDNPYLFLATRFVYNYTHHQAVSKIVFSKEDSFIRLYQSSLEHLTYNCYINTITATI